MVEGKQCLAREAGWELDKELMQWEIYWSGLLLRAPNSHI